MAQWIAAVAAVAVFVTVAIVVAGFDARETPREDPSIWVARAGGQYARVNTETAEIDTVRQVESPSAVVQSAGLSLLLTQGLGRAWVIDQAAPIDIRDDLREPATDPTAEAAGGGEPESGGASGADASLLSAAGAGGAPHMLDTPDGTRQVLAAGERVLFLTEGGEVYLARVESAQAQLELSPPTRLDPLAANGPAENGLPTDADGVGASAGSVGASSRSASGGGVGYLADAVALDDTGRVAMYSDVDASVRWYDSVSGEYRGIEPVPAGVPAVGVQLAIIGGRWVLFDADSGTLWRDRGDPIEVDVVGRALLQRSSLDGDNVHIADEGGLWRVDRDGAVTLVAEAAGVPARPEVAGELVAAWLNGSGGQLWTSSEGLVSLAFDTAVDALTEPEPVIRTNGSRALVADTGTGMLWTVPSGQLIPLEQWSLVDPPKDQQGEVVTQDPPQQEPPVAVDDAFGVRAGEPAPLPVLLNDYDPNRSDVLTVVPDGVGAGLPADFGTVTMLSDGQGLVVQPTAAASGSAAFTYRITDGITVSEPATVTLTVAPDGVNSPPAWCPVVGCQREWPSPEVTPGGTLVLPLLEGWVDPEGDPMMLADAQPRDPADPLRAVVTAEGRLAVRHTDPNSAAATFGVIVRVVDALGESTERELTLRVRPDAALTVEPIAITVQTGETQVLRPLERALGGSGSFELVDAVVQQGALATAVNQNAGTVEVTAEAAGVALVAVTVRDSVTGREATATMRVTAVDNRGTVGVPPLRAFVRPLADTTVDVLAALPSASSRDLTLRSAAVQDGQLQAEIIEHAQLRLSGSTADGQPGRIGAVDLVIDEGGTTAAGRLTVFQVPEFGAAGAIAVADTAVVRAGSLVDIRVLENDVAPPGERLVLSPAVAAPGLDGELAFASGSVVRYLAPESPGTYTLSYSVSTTSRPEVSDVGQVRVTVLPEGPNRVPQPATLTVRVAPGERGTTVVPLSGVDPDGDRLRLIAIGAPADPSVSATLAARRNAVIVQASPQAPRGTQVVSYTVRDVFGGEAEGLLRIIVTEPNPAGNAPVVYTDEVRIARGTNEPAVVRPLDNDLDPAGGELQLIDVEPNVPGGPESPLYGELAARLDRSRLGDGEVRVAGGPDLGTVSYRYTVRSSATTSTADGLIVVQVTDRVNPQAPAITDTVLAVRERADFERVGVDVVTDRVRWAGGDPSALTLSLWGSAAERYRVEGSNIIGRYRASGDLVPFRLAGVDATGAAVESFGFLIVPPLDDLRLTLRSGVPPVTVAEGQSVTARLADVVDLGPGDRLDLAAGPFTVQRAQARCEVVDGGAIRYTAGREAPWSDTCTVRVKLAEQTVYTSLAVPIRIVPDAPVAVLNPVTRTVAPGQTETIALTDMLTWQGGRVGAVSELAWRVNAGAQHFEVTQSGATLRVTARADAQPGAQHSATVSVSGAGDSQAALTLRVGQAAPDRPRGATVPLRCTVGSTCVADLVGQPGEFDPFAGAPGAGLTLVSVAAAACETGTFAVDGPRVRVTWTDPRGPGELCTASFVVRDAQNRTGTGIIEFDAQGVPRAPDSISQVGYTESTVRLRVQLGEAQAAHPAVTGVVIDIDGTRSAASCTSTGGIYDCVVGGLEVGRSHAFTARAVNSVGESAPTANAVIAWAYRAPAAPEVSVTQVSAESAATGTVRFALTPGDGTTGGYRVTLGSQSQNVAIGDTPTFSGAPVGSLVWQVVPLSRFTVPPGDSADGSAISGAVTVEGRPSVQVRASSEPGTNQVTVTVSAQSNGGANLTHGYGWVTGDATAPCDATSRAGGSTTETFTAPRHRTLTIAACAANTWGASERVETRLLVGGEIAAPVVVAGFSIAETPVLGPDVADYPLAVGPTVTASDGATLEYEVQGVLRASFPAALDPALLANARVRQATADSTSGWAAIPSNAPTAVRVDLSGCIAPGSDAATLRERISLPARSSASPSYDGATLTVSWSGAFATLATLAVPVTACAAPGAGD